MEKELYKFQVWMKSVPGMFAQYDGKVDVWAEDPEDAIEKAHQKLRRGAFPDRSRDMWKIVKVEKVTK